MSWRRPLSSCSNNKVSQITLTTNFGSNITPALGLSFMEKRSWNNITSDVASVPSRQSDVDHKTNIEVTTAFEGIGLDGKVRGHDLAFPLLAIPLTHMSCRIIISPHSCLRRHHERSRNARRYATVLLLWILIHLPCQRQSPPFVRLCDPLHPLQHAH